MLIVGMLALLVYWFIPQESIDTSSQSIDVSQEQIILPRYEDARYADIPEVRAYIDEVSTLLAQGKAVLPLGDEELYGDAHLAQKLVLEDADFLEDTMQNAKYLHNDMMRVIPVITSVLDVKTAKICKKYTCYKAEKYNYATNTTTRAIIDVDNKKVLDVKRFPNAQPDISKRLMHIAQAIALNAPEIKEALGRRPSKKDISMANVRGSLKESPCENTMHLCVAPTFVDHKKEQALWAVIDLTQMRLVAAKWTGLGKTTTPACISERSLQNRYIMENYCQKDTILNKNDWQITYRLTGSDGLEIRDVKYKGKSVLHSAKIVDWHVAYKQKGARNLDDSTETYIEGRRVEFVRGEGDEYLFGYNDAMGCPLFSTSVVLAFNGPQVRKLKNDDGFMLTQDFRNPKWPMACNYRYENRFEFYDDGSFRIVGVNKGRGCGDNAIYRPVMRIDMDIDKKENFYNYDGEWKLWEKEAFEKVSTVKNEQQYPYKIVSALDEKKGYYIETNYGQFSDNSRGDHATLFLSKFKEKEGDTDLLTIGSCCDLNDDGVEQFINDENTSTENLVLWYVPRIFNDAKEGKEYCWADTIIGDNGKLEVKVWPCIVGPKFIPIR